MLVYGKILQDFYDLQHDILRRSTHSLSTTTPLAIGVSFFSIVSLLTSNKIIKELKSTHCCRSVRGLETLSLGGTVCLQIRSLRRLIYRKLPAPQATSRLNDCPHCCKILQIRSISCLMCSQLGIRFNQFKIVRKALFF